MTAATPSIEPLGEALNCLRVSAAFYCRSEFTSPWAMAIPPMPGSLMFHIVLAGDCRISIGGGAPREMTAGDIVVVSRGEGHELSSGSGVPAVKLFDLPRDRVSDRYEIVRHGGGGAACQLLCGALRIEHPAAHRLVNQLPEVIAVPASSVEDAHWIQRTVTLLCAEARELRPGGETIITRLADVLLIHAIRYWIETEPASRRGWLGALRDQQIGRALFSIHQHPERRWTVALLAAEAGMSRSTFAARFAAFLGDPPMQFVARSRMDAAAAALADEGTPVADIAERFGYQSEAAFRRSFKRLTGRTPGSARHSPAR